MCGLTWSNFIFFVIMITCLMKSAWFLLYSLNQKLNVFQKSKCRWPFIHLLENKWMKNKYCDPDLKVCFASLVLSSEKSFQKQIKTWIESWFSLVGDVYLEMVEVMLILAPSFASLRIILLGYCTLLTRVSIVLNAD